MMKLLGLKGVRDLSCPRLESGFYLLICDLLRKGSVDPLEANPVWIFCRMLDLRFGVLLTLMSPCDFELEL